MLIIFGNLLTTGLCPQTDVASGGLLGRVLWARHFWRYYAASHWPVGAASLRHHRRNHWRRFSLPTRTDWKPSANCGVDFRRANGWLGKSPAIPALKVSDPGSGRGRNRSMEIIIIYFKSDICKWYDHHFPTPHSHLSETFIYTTYFMLHSLLQIKLLFLLFYYRIIFFAIFGNNIF